MDDNNEKNSRANNTEPSDDSDRTNEQTGRPDMDRSGFPDDVFDESAEDRGDPFDSEDSMFTQVDIDTEDPDNVWEQLTRDEQNLPEVKKQQRIVTVPKQTFCEQCPYLSEPPEIMCEHETGEIQKIVSPSKIRIVNCPVVERREEMGLDVSDEIEDEEFVME